MGEWLIMMSLMFVAWELEQIAKHLKKIAETSPKGEKSDG